MRRLGEHIRANLWRWLLGTAMLLLTNAATMAIPELFRRAIDGLRRGEDAHALRQIAWTMVGVAVAGAAFRTLSRVHILYAARDVEMGLRARFYAHLTALDGAFYQNFPTGDLMSRATNDLTQVRLMLGPGFLNLINTVVAYAAAIPLMARINPTLTCVAFVIYPPALFLMRRLGKALYARNRHQQAALGQLSNVVQENLAAAMLVRASAIEPEQQRRFDAANGAYLAANDRLAKLRSGMFRLGASMASLGMLAIAYFGARDVMAGTLSLGDIVALLEYMALLSGPTFALGWVLSLWQRGAASLARLDEIMLAQPSMTSGPGALGPEPAPIEAVDLAVRYGDRAALDGISFAIPRGHTLGIVGAIGSGKTTLAQALMRLVPLGGGTLRFGGLDVAGLDNERVREAFAYVPQNATLLHKSVADNIAFGAPGASLALVRAALEVAAFAAEAEALPQGLDTIVGERGVTLSGGQKQRCALARALLLERPVLLLDDALSAVDAETEQRILASLKARQAGRTTLIIAHRASSVAHADEIIVLAAGKIAERGTHAQLVQAGGHYADIVRRQQMADGGPTADAEAAGQPNLHGAPA